MGSAKPRVLQLREGATVTCPKCGRPGVVAVDSFRAKGREYKYWVVRHGSRRCILKRYEEPRKVPAQQRPLLSEEAFREEKAKEEKPVEEARPAGAAVESYPRELDRRAWYIVKLLSSLGALKENPTAENLSKLKSTAAQVEERLGVAVGELLKAAEDFLAAKSDTAKMRLNEAAKLLVCRTTASLLFAERKVKGLEPSAALAVAVTPAIASLEEKVRALDEKVSALESVKNLEERVRGIEERLSALPSLTESIKSLEEKVSTISVEHLAEEVAKRLPAAAAPRQKVKGLREMVLDVLSDGKPRTREEIRKEIEKRFNATPSLSSLSGRLTELVREGLVIKEEKEGHRCYAIAEQRKASA